MDNNEISTRHLIATNPNTAANQSNPKPLNTIISDPIIFGTIISFTLCWLATFIVLYKRLRTTRKKVNVDIKSSAQIPCKNCNFYSNDPHLKCAVNPSTVLTEEAVNCADYSAQENKSL